MHEQITALGWAWHGNTCKCEPKGRLYLKGIYKLKNFDNGTFKLTIKNRIVAADSANVLIETIKQLT